MPALLSQLQLKYWDSLYLPRSLHPVVFKANALLDMLPDYAVSEYTLPEVGGKFPIQLQVYNLHFQKELKYSSN